MDSFTCCVGAGVAGGRPTSQSLAALGFLVQETALLLDLLNEPCGARVLAAWLGARSPEPDSMRLGVFLVCHLLCGSGKIISSIFGFLEHLMILMSSKTVYEH